MTTPFHRAHEPVPYRAEYVLEDVLGSRGPVPQRFVLPAAATSLWPTLRSNDIALVEAGTNRVTMLATTGHLRRTLHAPSDTRGGHGVSSRPLRHPSGIASHERDLIIADTSNHRLLRMRVDDGRPISNATFGQRHFGAALTPLRFPRGVAVIVHEWPPHGVMPMLCAARRVSILKACLVSIIIISPHISSCLSVPVEMCSNATCAALRHRARSIESLATPHHRRRRHRQRPRASLRPRSLVTSRCNSDHLVTWTVAHRLQRRDGALDRIRHLRRDERRDGAAVGGGGRAHARARRQRRCCGERRRAGVRDRCV
jgi:hypothetical protein